MDFRGMSEDFELKLTSGKQPHNELENHHFQWVKLLCLWPFSIAMLV